MRKFHRDSSNKANIWTQHPYAEVAKARVHEGIIVRYIKIVSKALVF